MALPQVETGVMEMVAEEEANEKRQAALAESKALTTGAEVKDTNKALAAVADMKEGSKEPFVMEGGFDDVKVDFTSFPTVTLNNQKFSTTEHENFGEVFDCVMLSRRKVFLFRGDLGRDKDPELHYSSDGLTDDKEGKPIAEYIEDWKSRGIEYDRKEYDYVMVNMIDGPHESEICQIQVSPASRGKLAGYIKQLELRRKQPSEVVTQVGIGPTVGSGIKAFNPFTFKLIG
jgi:hypothetical protein